MEQLRFHSVSRSPDVTSRYFTEEGNAFFLERLGTHFGTRSERKWNAFGTQMERVWNANGTRSERVTDAFGTQMERERMQC